MSDLYLDKQLKRIFGLEREFVKTAFEFIQYLITYTADLHEKKTLEDMFDMSIKDKDAISIIEVVNLPKEKLEEFRQINGIADISTIANGLDKSVVYLLPKEYLDDLKKFVKEYNSSINIQLNEEPEAILDELNFNVPEQVKEEVLSEEIGAVIQDKESSDFFDEIRDNLNADEQTLEEEIKPLEEGENELIEDKGSVEEELIFNSEIENEKNLEEENILEEEIVSEEVDDVIDGNESDHNIESDDTENTAAKDSDIKENANPQNEEAEYTEYEYEVTDDIKKNNESNSASDAQNDENRNVEENPTEIKENAQNELNSESNNRTEEINDSLKSNSDFQGNDNVKNKSFESSETIPDSNPKESHKTIPVSSSEPTGTPTPMQQTDSDRRYESIAKQEEQRKKREQFERTSLGNGSIIPDSSNSQSHEVAKNSPKTVANAEIFEMKLKHSSVSEFKSKANQATYDAISMQKDQIRESNAYKGYKESKTHFGIASISASQSGSKAIMQDVHVKMSNLDSRGDFKYLNTILKENGYINKSSALNFGTKDQTKHSLDSVNKMLVDKKIIKTDKFGKIDYSGMRNLSLEDFAKRLKIKDLTQAGIIKGNLDAFMKDYAVANNSMIKRKFGKFKYTGKLIKDYSKDNLALAGMQQVISTYKTAKQTYAATKAGVKFTKSLLKNNTITKTTTRVIDKKLTGFKSYDSLKEKHKIKTQRKSDKATSRYLKKQDATERKLKKIQTKKEVKKNKTREIKRKFKKTTVGKRIRTTKRSIIQKIPFKARRFANRAGNVASKILKAPVNVFKAFNFASAFMQKLKLVLIKYIGGAALFLALLGSSIIIIMMPFTYIFGFFDKSEILESSFGKLYLYLIDEEENWAKSMSDVGVNVKPKIDSIKYTRGQISIKEYASQIGTTYDETSKTVLGPMPFENAPATAFKNIGIIDGGNELTFEGANGPTGRISNIKDILSMTAVYFQQESVKLSEDFSEEEVKEDLNFFENSINTLKKISVNYLDFNNTVLDKMKQILSFGFDSTAVLKSYAGSLYHGSHQEEVNLELLLLPTKYTLYRQSLSGNADGDAGAEVSDLIGSGVDICPKDDGCTAYHDFFYKSTISDIFVRNADGTYTDVTNSVSPEKYDFCSAPTANLFPESYNRHSECWDTSVVVTEKTIATWSNSKPKPTPAPVSSAKGSGFKKYAKKLTDEEIAELNKKHTYETTDTTIYSTAVNPVLRNAINSACVTQAGDSPSGSLSGISVLGDNKYSYTTNIGNEYEVKTGEDDDSTFHARKQKVAQVIFTHNCKGGHTGHYCGGHLKANTVGIVYSITDEQLDGKIVGKIEKKVYQTERDRLKDQYNKSQNIDESKIRNAKDIFDVDLAIKRSVSYKIWDSWTKSNMEWVIALFSQDWEDLYGLTFSSSLGGSPFTDKEIEAKLNEFISVYEFQHGAGSLSAERQRAMYKSLFYVGKIGYDQRKHMTMLPEPEDYGILSGNLFSDCSGFCSNMWYGKLNRIYTTATFYTSFNLRKFSDGGCKPGDILLHYDGRIADGNGDHALVYMGIGSDGEHYSVDCTTVNGIGQVRLATRSYYDSCYYLAMD